MNRVLAAVAIGATALASVACDRIMPNRTDVELPPVDSVRAVYEAQGVTGDVEFSGNVVELRVTQSEAELRRGGSLWARVGPFIYVFSPGTRTLFERYDGISGVRAITRTEDGEEVGRALLVRDRLNDVTWQRALNLLGRALQEGTARPTRLEELVRWGEANTEYEYNTEFAPER